MFARWSSDRMSRPVRLLGMSAVLALAGVGLVACGEETHKVEFTAIAVDTGEQPSTKNQDPANLTSLDWKIGPSLGGDHGKVSNATDEPLTATREAADLSDVRLSFEIPQAAQLAAKCTIKVDGQVVAEQQDNIKPGRALCTYVDD